MLYKYLTLRRKERGDVYEKNGQNQMLFINGARWRQLQYRSIDTSLTQIVGEAGLIACSTQVVWQLIIVHI